jgi:hypothetical protein
MNPSRAPGANGYGWHKIDRTKFGAAVSKANLARTKEVGEKISKSIQRKVSNGEWHHGAGRAKKSDYNGVRLDSTWELKLVEYWDSVGIKWKRNTKVFPYTWNGKNRFYLPDFYLEEDDIFVEVKGYKTERDDAKWKAFPLKLVVYDRMKFEELNIGV